jgi:DNA-binding response OmpR family regulator
MVPLKKADHPLHLMVVDDNPDIGNSLAWLLRCSGHEVAVAFSGREALAKMRDFSPDAVILDLGMPQMSGLELARRIRAQPDFERLPLIAVTAWGQEADRRAAFDAGIDEYLVKPADPNELMDLLGHLQGSS